MIARALTIAGSDSGGGAGIQADLKAFAAAGAHGMSAIVALTAQNTAGVTAVHEVPAEFVIAQLEAVFSDIGVDAAKTGMLFSRAVIEAVAAFLAGHPVPVVVDPVMIASSGAQLLQDDAVGRARVAALPACDRHHAEPDGGAGARRRRRLASELAARLVELGTRAAMVPAGTAMTRSTISSTAASTSRSRSSGSTSLRRTAPAARTPRHSQRCSRAGCRWSRRRAPRLAPPPTRCVRSPELGAGDGPVDILNVKGRTCPGTSLRSVRERKPLVHQITNYVVMNETANATLALGALPVMAHAREEVAEMARIAGALVLNIGTLSPHWVEAMLIAGAAANDVGVPVVLDPVGAGATSYRTETSKRILDEVDVAVLRGNAGEVATLVGVEAEVRGVESIAAGDDAAAIAHAAASTLGVVASVTGPVDHVSDGTAPLRSRTGTRCSQLSPAPGACRARSPAASSPSPTRSRPPSPRSSPSASPARTLRAMRRGRARSTSGCTTRSLRSIPTRSTSGARVT